MRQLAAAGDASAPAVAPICICRRSTPPLTAPARPQIEDDYEIDADGTLTLYYKAPGAASVCGSGSGLSSSAGASAWAGGGSSQGGAPAKSAGRQRAPRTQLVPDEVDKAIKQRASIIMARHSGGYYYTSSDKDKYWTAAETALLEGVLKLCSRDPELASVSETSIRTRLLACVHGWGGVQLWITRALQRPSSGARPAPPRRAAGLRSAQPPTHLGPLRRPTFARSFMRNVNTGITGVLQPKPGAKPSHSASWLHARRVEARTRVWYKKYGAHYKERNSGAVPQNDTWFGTYASGEGKEVRCSAPQWVAEGWSDADGRRGVGRIVKCHGAAGHGRGGGRPRLQPRLQLGRGWRHQAPM